MLIISRYYYAKEPLLILEIANAQKMDPLFLSILHFLSSTLRNEMFDRIQKSKTLPVNFQRRLLFENIHIVDKHKTTQDTLYETNRMSTMDLKLPETSALSASEEENVEEDTEAIAKKKNKNKKKKKKNKKKQEKDEGDNEGEEVVGAEEL
eukprot:Platyproteum_vivax@DN4497_c0_g1_i1.p1